MGHNQGFVIGEEFFGSLCDFFLLISFCQNKSHTDIFVNQSEASTSELVSSLSAFESK